MSSHMAKSTILLTGGTGKVSRRIAPLLSASGHAILIASRSGNTPSVQLYEGVKFDWFDSTTFHQPFEYGPISAIFLVAPPIMYCLPPMKEFIELAIQKGTKRFVLLSGSLVDSGDGPMMAQVSNYLAHLNVEYAILQPTWFMENFSEMEHLQTIRDRDTIVTATGEGKVPFVSVDDIAAVAVRALTDEVSHNTEHLILGQDLWSYDDVAQLLTKKLSRTITHTKVTEDEVATSMSASGIPEEYARVLAQLDTAVKQGLENRVNDVVQNVTGKTPVAFEAFVDNCIKNGVWEKQEEY